MMFIPPVFTAKSLMASDGLQRRQRTRVLATFGQLYSGGVSYSGQVFTFTQGLTPSSLVRVTLAMLASLARVRQPRRACPISAPSVLQDAS